MVETTMQTVPARTDGMAMDAPAGDPESEADPQGQQASPEEQAMYDKVVANGMVLMYSEKTFPRILEMLQGEGDPKQGLATATASIVTRVAQSAEQNGQDLSGDILLHAGTEIFEELANIATKAGIHDFENDPDAMEGALFSALDQYRAMLQQAGKIDQKAAAEDMMKLEQMDESGQLDAMFRGLAQNGRRDEQPARQGGGLAEAAGVM